MFLLTACLEVNPKPQNSYHLSSVFREERLKCANGNALGLLCTNSSGERQCTLKWERFTNTGKYTHRDWLARQTCVLEVEDGASVKRYFCTVYGYAGKVDLTRVIGIQKGNCQPITERS